MMAKVLCWSTVGSARFSVRPRGPTGQAAGSLNRTIIRYCLGPVACLFECFLLFFQPAFSTTCMLIHDEPVPRLESLPDLGDIRDRCVLWPSVFQRNTSIRIGEHD